MDLTKVSWIAFKDFTYPDYKDLLLVAKMKLGRLSEENIKENKRLLETKSLLSFVFGYG